MDNYETQIHKKLEDFITTLQSSPSNSITEVNTFKYGRFIINFENNEVGRSKAEIFRDKLKEIGLIGKDVSETDATTTREGVTVGYTKSDSVYLSTSFTDKSVKISFDLLKLPKGISPDIILSNLDKAIASANPQECKALVRWEDTDNNKDYTRKVKNKLKTLVNCLKTVFHDKPDYDDDNNVDILKVEDIGKDKFAIEYPSNPEGVIITKMLLEKFKSAGFIDKIPEIKADKTIVAGITTTHENCTINIGIKNNNIQVIFEPNQQKLQKHYILSMLEDAVTKAATDSILYQHPTKLIARIGANLEPTEKATKRFAQESNIPKPDEKDIFDIIAPENVKKISTYLTKKLEKILPRRDFEITYTDPRLTDNQLLVIFIDKKSEDVVAKVDKFIAKLNPILSDNTSTTPISYFPMSTPDDKIVLTVSGDPLRLRINMNAMDKETVKEIEAQNAARR